MELVAFFMIAFDRCWAQVFMPFCSRHSNYDIIQHFVLVHLSELLLLYTLPLEISVPPQIHAFSNFLVQIPKHLVRNHSYMSVPQPGTVYHTVSAILTLRHHLDRL